MTKNTKKGFTIVELLIVIVVIGILATIVVVTYQGVQNKARTTQAQATAKGILDKAEVYNSEMAKYPTMSQLTTDTADGFPNTAKLDDNQKSVLGKKVDATEKGIGYALCGGEENPTGAKTSYFDFEKKEVKEIKTGSGC